MKLKIKQINHKVNPKQTKGLLVIRYYNFTVKPKEGGVKLFNNKHALVLKHDLHYGVQIIKNNNTMILNQQD